MQNIAVQIAQRRCPRCHEQGSLRLQMAYACVVCTACGKSFIDPFEEGPWDDQQTQPEDVILDTVDGQVVYSYQLPTEDPVEEAEIEKAEAWSDFYRYLQEREGKSNESTRTD